MAKKVVILGGGFAGTGVAKSLDGASQVSVTLIDSRDVFVHKIGGLRSAVDPTWQDIVLIPRSKLFKRDGNKVVKGKVVSISENDVTLENGETIPFDYLVCATGAQNRSPGEPSVNLTTVAEIKTHFSTVSEALKRSAKIVIIGGGVVGVEFSGEIRDKYPDKEITIIHSGATLASATKPPLKFKPSFHRKLEAQMKKKNIKYILGERAVMDPSWLQGSETSFVEGVGSVRTEKGQEIPADIVFLCTGTKIMSSFYPQDFLAANGCIKVQPTLQVQGKTNVFACGDIIDTTNNKMAMAIHSQVPVVTANILALAKGGSAKKHYKGFPGMMMVSLGRKGGVFVTPFGTFGSTPVSMIKGKNLLAPYSWADNRQKAPKLPKF